MHSCNRFSLLIHFFKQADGIVSLLSAHQVGIKPLNYYNYSLLSLCIEKMLINITDIY